MVAILDETAPMKIHVSRIPAEGRNDQAHYDPTTMEMDRDDVHLVEPFEVHAFTTLAGEELVVTADIHCPMRLSCARCLEEFASTAHPSAIFSYKVEPTDVVDITDDIRQEIILAYPIVPICRPDCLGLCSACGQNLNVKPCFHH